MEDLHKRIQEKKELIKAKITDSVTNQDEILEKGIYKDNEENRKAGRVGQKYGGSVEDMQLREDGEKKQSTNIFGGKPGNQKVVSATLEENKSSLKRHKELLETTPEDKKSWRKRVIRVLEKKIEEDSNSSSPKVGDKIKVEGNKPGIFIDAKITGISGEMISYTAENGNSGNINKNRSDKISFI